ncbi:hypothetical protein [Arthrobacter sp. Y81]|uniref:hypothetical protein n=1 Tax=Arthrobacter sp. Y81 TaxID=2058897 RepID=UPI002157DDA1|nr:hypothetical protein [Arthrobacter sp. Y81]
MRTTLFRAGRCLGILGAGKRPTGTSREPDTRPTFERLHMRLPVRYSITTATAVAAAFILSGCSTAAPAPAPEPTTETSSSAAPAPAGANLADAVSGCGLDGADGVELTADGTKLSIDTKGPRETSGAAMTDVQCVLGALEVPKDITSMMKLTTSTAEPTDAAWEDLGFAWNYSPENHFRLAIVQV